MYYPSADLDRVFISGHSAGGHLASLVAVDPQYLREQQVEPSFIKGVISISGVYQVDMPLSQSYCGVMNGGFRSLYTKAAFGYSRRHCLFITITEPFNSY
jgi:acetyl esterase/lipase